MNIYVSQKLSPLEAEKFLKDFYFYAYRIAKKFKTTHLADYEKETIALESLENAIKTYDPEKGKFGTFLNILIMNRLRDANIKVKRAQGTLPTSLDAPDTKDKAKGRMDRINFDNKEPSIIDELIQEQGFGSVNFSFFNILIQQLDAKLTQRQSKVLEMLMSPKLYMDEYEKQFGKPIRKLNYHAVSKLLKTSPSTITQEIKKIKQVTTEILSSMEK